MNGIQKYFVAIATEAIREAAGRLVANGDINPSLVIESMKEITEILPTLATTVHCDLDFTGCYDQRRTRLADSAINPIFIQPS